MRGLLTRYKKVILGGVVLLLLFLGYRMFFSGSSAPVSTSPLSVQSTGAAGSQELLAILLRLQSLHLDTTVFTSPVFQSLKDFGREIPPEPVGRPNPFAPI